MISLNIKLLELCKPGELLRVSTGTSIEWAIKAAAPTGAHWLVVLSGEAAPWCDDISDMGILNRACLCYGSEFSVEPDHLGPVAVDEGDMIIEKGVLLLAKPIQAKDETSHYLACSIGPKPNGVKRLWLNVNTFLMGGEPGGHRAAFRKWGVYADMPTSREPVCLVGSP